LITEPIVLSKKYLDTARILLDVASNMTEQTTADFLRDLADDCVGRAVKRSQADKALAALTALGECQGSN
jgi:hypothetical protein